MSEKSFIGSNLQIPSGVRWGGNGTVGDVGGNNCMYVFQVVDQNGEPIQTRQQVKVGACVCTTAVGTTDAGLGHKVPTAAEIASSALEAQANTVFVVAAGAAVDVKVGSEDPAGTMHLDGHIGAYGTLQSYIPVVGGGATYVESIFETDTTGKLSIRVTALADSRAVVITLASGKVLYFNSVRAA